MNHYLYKKEVNVIKLQREIENVLAFIPIFGHVEYAPEDQDLKIFFKEELSAMFKNELDQIVNSHDASSDPIGQAHNSIRSMKRFGENIMDEYAAENMVTGITAAGKSEAVLDYFDDVMQALKTGSLDVVIRKLSAKLTAGVPAELSPFVTEFKIQQMISRIVRFLKDEGLM